MTESLPTMTLVTKSLATKSLATKSLVTIIAAALMSMGIAVLDEPRDTLAELVNTAGCALAEATSAGHNRCA